MDIGEKMLTSHGEYLRWAGHEHGYVTEKEYHQLGKSNQLKLGSQTWNFLGQTLQGAATSLYRTLPDEWEQVIEEKGTQALQGIVSGYNNLPEPVQEQLTKIKTGFIDIPAQALQNLSDLDGQIATSNPYRGLHPGPLELLGEGVLGLATSGGSLAIKKATSEGLEFANEATLRRLVAATDTPAIYSGLPLPNSKPTKPKTSKKVKQAQELLDGINPLGIVKKNGNGHVKKNTNHSTKVKNNPDLSQFKAKTGKGKSDAITPEGVEGIYGVTKGKKQIPHPEQGPLSGNVDLHHEVGKDIRYDFTAQARNLDPKGQAALDAIDAEYGLQSGSGADALKPINKIPHNRTHNSERRFLDTKDSFMSGNEPSGRFLQELRNDIAGASSLEELKTLYRNYIERSVLPFNEKARLFQRAYEKAGTPKTMTEADLKNYAKLQKAQEEARKDLDVERTMELLDFPID